MPLSIFPEGTTVLASDSEWRLLAKAAYGANTGGSGTSSQQVYTGAAPPAAPDDPTKPALFYPSSGGAIKEWDVAGGAWI